jgi:drug/metabolite transporter (DMT)-like permease
MILTATAGFGLVPMFAQMMMQAGYDADTITLYRIALPLLLFVGWFRPRGLYPMEVIRTMLLGMFGGIGMALYMRALSQTSAATVILLYYSYPFFSIVLGNLFFGQRMTRNSLSSALLILVAVSLTLDPESISPEELPLMLGSLLAPISFALMIQYFALPLKSMAPGQRMVMSAAGTLLAFVPLILLTGTVNLLPNDGSDYVWILVIGIISAALPQYLFVKGAPLAGAGRTAGLTSLEVVVAMLMGVLVMGQQLNRMQVTAAVLIVIAQLIRQDIVAPVQREPLAHRSV